MSKANPKKKKPKRAGEKPLWRRPSFLERLVKK